MLPGTCEPSAALNMAAPGAQVVFLPTHDARACLLRGEEKHQGVSLPRHCLTNGDHWFLSKVCWKVMYYRLLCS